MCKVCLEHVKNVCELCIYGNTLYGQKYVGTQISPTQYVIINLLISVCLKTTLTYVHSYCY